jgi:hypothetical protein
MSMTATRPVFETHREDGHLRRRDEYTYQQRFTPRRARSVWSRRNVGIAERLIAEGRMHAAGLAEATRAKRADTRARRIGQVIIEKRSTGVGGCELMPTEPDGWA